MKMLIFSLISQVTHEVCMLTQELGVVCGALCNCVVRIGHLYSWKEHSDILLHNNSTIKVRMG